MGLFVILLNEIPNDFFVKLLTNKGKKKTTTNYKVNLFLTIYPLLKRFLKIKNKIDLLDGEVYIQRHECYLQVFIMSHTWPYLKRGLLFRIINFRQLTRLTTRFGDFVLVLPLLKFLTNQMRPLLSAPKVWLWILWNSFKQEEAIAFAEKHLKQYVLKVSTHIWCKIKSSSS